MFVVKSPTCFASAVALREKNFRCGLQSTIIKRKTGLPVINCADVYCSNFIVQLNHSIMLTQSRTQITTKSVFPTDGARKLHLAECLDLIGYNSRSLVDHLVTKGCQET